MLCPRYTIQLSVEERQQIEALLRAGKTQQRVAKRAAAILLAEAGMNNQEIADHLETSRHWVQKWRKRFAHYEAKAPPSEKEVGPPVRLPALDDLPRSGRPPVFSPSGPSRSGERGLSGRAGAGLQWVVALQRARPGEVDGQARRSHHDESGDGSAHVDRDGAESASGALLADTHRPGV